MFENQQHAQPIYASGSGIRMLRGEPSHHVAIPARGKCYHARCVDVFVEDENAR